MIKSLKLTFKKSLPYFDNIQKAYEACKGHNLENIYSFILSAEDDHDIGKKVLVIEKTYSFDTLENKIIEKICLEANQESDYFCKYINEIIHYYLKPPIKDIK